MFIDEMNRSGDALPLTTGIEKDFMRLLERAKNEPNNELSRQNLKSACEALSRNASKKVSQDTPEKVDNFLFYAKIMSAAIFVDEMDMIKSVVVCLATWLLPDTIAMVATACRKHGWLAMKDT
jgi:hypothetical protein